MKERLALLSADDITRQSDAAQAAVTNMKQWQQAQRVSIYLSMPAGELQTTTLISKAFQDGKKVFVPHIVKLSHPDSGTRKAMDMLRLSSLEEYKSLRPDAWGIPTLPKGDNMSRENALGGSDGGLDLIVVPGVAFDHTMGRLGHGAGYYDSYLTRYTQAVPGHKPFLGTCRPAL